MELNLKQQTIQRQRMAATTMLNIDQADKELREAISSPLDSKFKIPNNSLFYSAAIDKDKNNHLSDQINGSRFSIDKNEGEWNSEFDSATEETYSAEEIKHAIEILSKAQLLNEQDVVQKLNDFMNKSGSANIEYILDLMSISKDNSKNKRKLEISSFNSNFDITTPKNSFYIKGNILSTIQSPGHKAPINNSSSRDVQYDEIMSVPSIFDMLGLKDASEDISVIVSSKEGPKLNAKRILF